MSKKIYILYSLYLQRQKLNEESKKDFFDYIAKFLNIPKENTNEANKSAQGSTTEVNSSNAGQALCDSMPRLSVSELRFQMTLDTGFQFSIALIKELGKVNKDLLVSSL